MALANFFDKTVFGIAQLLNGADATTFSKQLEAHRIRIQFSRHTLSKKEGVLILDLLTRLLARLYPHIRFRCSDDDCHPRSADLLQLAQSINPMIDFGDEMEDTIIVHVGLTKPLSTSAQQFFVGSDQWIGHFSSIHPQTCHNSDNPFGAGFAACLTAANLFRFVFREHLPVHALDDDLSFSVFDYSVNESAKQGPLTKNVIFQDTMLVGLGAIGNGAAWAFKQINISGTLSIIDPEVIELSNLQRYILTTQKDIGRSKSEHISEHLQKSSLYINISQCSWQSFLQKRNNWAIPLVGVALDSARDRIAVQSSLPFKIINAWTQREQLGISRHFDFINKACLACLYLPSSARPSLSEEIAFNLNIPHLERDVIRKYLADHLKIDELLVQMIANENHIPNEKLRPFLGKSMEAFYSEIVCGGVFMRLTGNLSQTAEIHVPSAFESALAGIFLAAELCKMATGLGQTELPNSTKINLIRPLTSYTLDHAPKDQSGRCICKDPYYISAFAKKWNLL